jgi:hypothetical protein
MLPGNKCHVHEACSLTKCVATPERASILMEDS